MSVRIKMLNYFPRGVFLPRTHVFLRLITPVAARGNNVSRGSRGFSFQVLRMRLFREKLRLSDSLVYIYLRIFSECGQTLFSFEYAFGEFSIEF